MPLKAKPSQDEMYLFEILRHNSGIYKITNTANDKFYIGSSKYLQKRWEQHIKHLLTGKHHSQYLQRSWTKHGSSIFKFSIILYCEPFDLLRYEQFFITKLKPAYNVSISAISPMKDRKQSDSARLLISKSLMGNKRTFGRLRPKEEMDRIKATKLRLGIPFISDKCRQRSVESRIKTYEGLVSPDGYEYKNITNLALFCRNHSLNCGNIQEVLNGRRRSSGGWVKLNSYYIGRTTVGDRHAKVYAGFISPTGVIFKNVWNLKKFCACHGLRYSTTLRVVCGQLKTCNKGWTLYA